MDISMKPMFQQWCSPVNCNLSNCRKGRQKYRFWLHSNLCFPNSTNWRIFRECTMESLNGWIVSKSFSFWDGCPFVTQKHVRCPHKSCWVLNTCADCTYIIDSQRKKWALTKAYKFTLKVEKLFWTLKSQDSFLEWKTKNLKIKNR